jgi:hypothetical protein
LILFHANFVPYSALGLLAFSAMIIVVGSGVVGRYIYVSLPKTLQGRELELEDLMRRLVVYRRKLIDLGVNPSVLQIGEPSERRTWLIGVFMRVFHGDRSGREELERLRAAISEKVEPGLQRDRILLLLQRLFTERLWLVRYQEIRKLMVAWRFCHRWLAIVLMFAVFFHIVIAVDFGNLWILGGATDVTPPQNPACRWLHPDLSRGANAVDLFADARKYLFGTRPDRGHVHR